MLYNIVAMGFMIGLFSMLFITPVKYSLGIMKLQYDDSMTTREKIMCFIPVINVAKAESIYLGRISFIAVADVWCVISLILRLFVVFKLTGNTAANVVTIVLFLLSIVAVFVANFISVFLVLKDAGTTGTAGLVLMSLFFPIGQYYIGTYLPTVVKNYSKREETF